MTGRDRGSADALGLVLLAPVLLGLALLVVFLSRQVDARAQVQTAAEAAAQAAALERSPHDAREAASGVAAAMLVDPDTCAEASVTVDLSQFAPGGLVAVTVTCTASTRGVEVIGTGPAAFSATATATVDPFRAVRAGP